MKAKFRVWDKKEEKFIETDSYTQVVITSNGLIFLSHTESVLFSEASMERLNAEDVELVQYTGLRDVNGTEIYEGDILICDPNHPNVRVMRTVEYIVNEYEGVGFKPMIDQYYDNGCLYEEYVIVGNIYENPELLEVK